MQMPQHDDIFFHDKTVVFPALIEIQSLYFTLTLSTNLFQIPLVLEIVRNQQSENSFDISFFKFIFSAVCL